MFGRKAVVSLISRAAVMATVAAVALTAVEPSLARAGSAPSGKGMSVAAPTRGATRISAPPRDYRGGRGGAAAAGLFPFRGARFALALALRPRGSYERSVSGA